MSNFYLKKWYLDIADEKGSAYIGYLATVKWGKFELNGFSHLFHSKKDGVKTLTGLGKRPLPVRHKISQLTWETPEIKATWNSNESAIKETLINNELGKVTWECLQPKALANIQSKNLNFSGFGYSECIEITIPVWKLPIKTLYWGRTHSQNYYLVWIKWEGETSKNLLWYNGKKYTDFIINDSEIKGYNCNLTFNKDLPLRQGKIIDTIFKPFSKIINIFPQPTFFANENKWLNIADLTIGNITEKSTTIYEKVMW